MKDKGKLLAKSLAEAFRSYENCFHFRNANVIRANKETISKIGRQATTASTTNSNNNRARKTKKINNVQTNTPAIYLEVLHEIWKCMRRKKRRVNGRRDRWEENLLQIEKYNIRVRDCFCKYLSKRETEKEWYFYLSCIQSKHFRTFKCDCIDLNDCTVYTYYFPWV